MEPKHSLAQLAPGQALPRTTSGTGSGLENDQQTPVSFQTQSGHEPQPGHTNVAIATSSSSSTAPAADADISTHTYQHNWVSLLPTVCAL